MAWPLKARAPSGRGPGQRRPQPRLGVGRGLHCRLLTFDI